MTLGTITVEADGSLDVVAEGDFTVEGDVVTFDGGTRTITPDAGSCEALTNTATVVDLTDTVDVEICADADLTISKTVAGNYGKTHSWSIDKSVDPSDPINLVGEQSDATVDYTVTVTYEGYELDISTVTGTITVTNPNDWSKRYSVTDTFAGTECEVTDATGSIPANDHVELAYSCTMPEGFEPSDEDTNVAKVAFTVAGVDETAETDPVTIDWDKNEMYANVSVYDHFEDMEGELLGTLDGNTMTQGDTAAFTYERTLDGEAGTCVSYDNTASVVDEEVTLDQDNATVDICQENALTVSKTVMGEYVMLHHWSIDKSVDPTMTEVTGTEASLAYDVVVSYDGYTTIKHKVWGTITVDNDNAWPRSFDATDDFAGVECVIEGDATVPAYDSVTLTYTCAIPAGFTPGDDINEVTVTADNIAGGTDAETASAAVEWAVYEAQNPVLITDEFRDEEAVELGRITVEEGELSTTGDGVVECTTVTYSYMKDIELEPGECITVPNTAKVLGDETVLDEAEAESELCAEADLVVTKTAEASATIQYLWDIEKKAVKTDFGVVQPDDVIWAEYIVTATPDGYEITEAALEGMFTITNPNSYKAVEVEITDVVSDGAWECTFDGDAVVIEAGATEMISYTCMLGDEAEDVWLDGEGTNTVTVSWTNADDQTSSVEYTVDYTLDVTELDRVVTVKDKFASRAETDLGTAEWVEGEATEFTYKTGMLIGSTPGKFSVDNVAWIVETGQEDDATVMFEVRKPPGLPKTGAGHRPMAASAPVLLAVRREEDEH